MRGPTPQRRLRVFDPHELDARTLAVAARVALARVQASHATWTRTELMRQIKVSLSADELGTDPHAAPAW